MIKIYQESSWSSKRYDIGNVEKAVAHCIEPDAYSYEGTKQKLAQTIDNQTRIIGLLVAILRDTKVIDNDKLKEILGSEYKIEDE